MKYTASLALLIVVTACTTATPPPGAPTLSAPGSPPVGASWVVKQKDSGSYGSGVQEVTWKRLPDQTYQTREVRVYDDGTEHLLVDAANGTWITRVRGKQPVESWDPPLG
jgi:hypothetical protein